MTTDRTGYEDWRRVQDRFSSQLESIVNGPAPAVSQLLGPFAVDSFAGVQLVCAFGIDPVYVEVDFYADQALTIFLGGYNAMVDGHLQQFNGRFPTLGPWCRLTITPTVAAPFVQTILLYGLSETPASRVTCGQSSLISSITTIAAGVTTPVYPVDYHAGLVHFRVFQSVAVPASYKLRFLDPSANWRTSHEEDLAAGATVEFDTPTVVGAWRLELTNNGGVACDFTVRAVPVYGVGA